MSLAQPIPTDPLGEPTKKIPANLWHSIYDVMFYSLMVGTGETYLAAYSLSLGVPERNAGLVTIIPILIGSVLQLVSHLGIKYVGSRQRWVVLCSCTQATALVYMAAIGLVSSRSHVTVHLFVAASVYWTAALAAGPAWNSWITSIVPQTQRVRFFALRTRYGQIASLIGLAAAGIVLELNASSKHRPLIFAGLFIFAALCRYLSAYFLMSQKPKIRAPKTVITDLAKPIADRKIFRTSTAIPTIWFMFMTQIAVQISGPYFTPYMLDELHLSYGRYMVLLAGVFLGRVAAAGMFEGIIARYGVKSLMVLGAIGVVPLPMCWLVSDQFYYLVALQFVAGIGWGAHELGFTLLLVEQLNEEERSRLLTATNLFNSVGMVIGSSLGAYLLGKLNPDQSDYFVIFAVSSALRCLPLLLLPRMLAIQVKPRHVFLKVLSIRVHGLNIIKPLFFKNGDD